MNDVASSHIRSVCISIQCLRRCWTQVLTEGDLTDLFSISVPCWPCRQAVSFLWVLCVTCLTRSRRFSTLTHTHTHTSETSWHINTWPHVTAQTVRSHYERHGNILQLQTDTWHVLLREGRGRATNQSLAGSHFLTHEKNAVSQFSALSNDMYTL